MNSCAVRILRWGRVEALSHTHGQSRRNRGIEISNHCRSRHAVAEDYPVAQFSRYVYKKCERGFLCRI